MERYPDFVVPDTFYPLTINGGDDGRYMVSPKYDRIDFVPRMGAFLLKIFDDDEGFVTMHVDKENAYRVQEATGLIIVPRDEIMLSEYKSIQNYQASVLDQIFKGEFDE